MNVLKRFAAVIAAIGIVVVVARPAACQESAIEVPPLSGWQFRAWPVGPRNANSIGQLPDGPIVIGTETGVLRFDGQRMTALPLPSAAAGKAVRLLLVAAKDTLHVVFDDATHACLTADDSWLAGTGSNVPAGEGDKGHEPTTICMDREGGVWIGHRNGLVSRTIGRDTEWHETANVDTWPGEAAVHVAADLNGRVWMARKGRLAVWSEGRWKDREKLSSGQLSLAAAGDGGLWIRVGGAVVHFDEVAGITRPFQSGVPTIREMRDDFAGRLWMATSRYGLVVWDGSRLATAPTTAPSIFTVFAGRDGGLWAGTAAGLERGEPSIVRRIDMPTVKPLRAVRSAADGDLWFLTLDGEVGCRRREPLPVSAPTSGSHGVVTALTVAADGTVWIGTEDGGVVRMASPSPAATHRAELAVPADLHGRAVRSLAATSCGALWVAVGRHLLWTDGHDWRRCNLPVDGAPADVTLVVEDDTGGAWAATADGRIVHASVPVGGISRSAAIDATRITVESMTPPDLPSGAVVTAICPLGDGGAWIATRQHGLWRCRDATWSRIGREHGLPSATLLAAVPDGRGRIWFAGERLFFVATQTELDEVAGGTRDRCHCWIASGASDLTFFDPAVMPPGLGTRDHEGRILVVLPTGLAVCEPGRLPAAPPPRVDVVEVRADGRVRAPIGHRGYGPLGSMVIAVPADTRTVSIMVAEATLSSTTNVRVQHRLDGIDADWVDTPPDRVIAYERLPAGARRIRFRSTTDTATWQSADRGITIDVEPRLFERPWFRVAVVLGVAGVAGGIVFGWQSWRSSQRIARLRELAALDRERMRIARDMHDDLGTSLTQISLLTELIRTRATDETACALHEVTTIARAAVSSLDEIVWSVNPRYDTLPHLLSYVSLHASQSLGRVGIRCTVDVPDSLEQGNIPTEFRRAVLFMVKEAVGNVIKHASAGNVMFSIRTVDGRLRLAVADDGCGITGEAASDRPRPSTGLVNLRERATDLGGTCTIRPRPEGGTIVEIDVPLPTT